MSSDTVSPAPAGKRPYVRRTIIINKSFQYKFIAIFVACVAVAIAIVAIDMFTSLGGYVASSFPEVDMKAVYRDSWIALAIKAAVYLAGIYVVGLIFSFHLAGPMFRFKKSAEEVATGNLSYRAFTRKGDEWGDFRISFNDMTASLQEKALKDASRTETVRRIIEDLMANPSLAPDIREKLKRAQTEISAVGKGFKLF
jgi:methyl-accepting chemotaxis protein